VAWELNTAQGFPFVALYWLGEVLEMNRRLPLLLLDARKRGNRYALTNVGVFAEPILASDIPEMAEEQLRECMDEWSRSGVYLQHFYELVAQTQIDLYRGRALDAWNNVNQAWNGIARSLLMRVQNIRITLHDIRARCALAAVESVSDRRQLLQAASRHARRLERERMAWAGALATLIRGEIALLHEDELTAARLLREGIARFDAVGMMLYAAATRRRFGQLLGGDEGSELIAAADSWMAGQKIKNPARMAAMFSPGLRD
jgi:hypothetical protein